MDTAATASAPSAPSAPPTLLLPPQPVPPAPEPKPLLALMNEPHVEALDWTGDWRTGL